MSRHIPCRRHRSRRCSPPPPAVLLQSSTPGGRVVDRGRRPPPGSPSPSPRWLPLRLARHHVARTHPSRPSWRSFDAIPAFVGTSLSMASAAFPAAHDATRSCRRPSKATCGGHSATSGFTAATPPLHTGTLRHPVLPSALGSRGWAGDPLLILHGPTRPVQVDGGLASQPHSRHPPRGLCLAGVFDTVRCDACMNSVGLYP